LPIFEYPRKSLIYFYALTFTTHRRTTSKFYTFFRAQKRFAVSVLDEINCRLLDCVIQTPSLGTVAFQDIRMLAARTCVAAICLMAIAGTKKTTRMNQQKKNTSR
jgi:hypothetical protein